MILTDSADTAKVRGTAGQSEDRKRIQNGLYELEKQTEKNRLKEKYRTTVMRDRPVNSTNTG